MIMDAVLISLLTLIIFYSKITFFVVAMAALGLSIADLQDERDDA